MNSIYDGRLLVVDDNEELCRMLTDMLHREGFRQVYTFPIGCVISCHGGPGAFGIAGFEEG